MSTPIPNPIVMTVHYNISSFYYQFIDLTLFQSANIRVSLMDDTGVMQKQVLYLLQGEEYTNWGGDDQYIVDLIIDKIPGWVNPPPTPDPTPDPPTPVDPTPVDPTPVDPTPVDPTTVDPTPPTNV